jgi:6-pyruvoyltetrahydropterin/6-carboxytetrahydropterin synthase
LILLSRRYRFSAAHVLARPEWSEARNRDVYGKCANPAGHGHNYELEVSVAGTPDARTGMLIPIGDLDALVADRVLAALDGRLLNRDLAEFRAAVPTAENIARFAFDRLEKAVAPLRLRCVRLVETANNSVEYSRGEAAAEGR